MPGKEKKHRRFLLLLFSYTGIFSGCDHGRFWKQNDGVSVVYYDFADHCL